MTLSKAERKECVLIARIIKEGQRIRKAKETGIFKMGEGRKSGWKKRKEKTHNDATKSH